MKDQERDALFSSARRAATPSQDDRRRVRAALHRRLGVAVGASVSATTVKAAASVGATAAAGAGGVGGVGGVGGLGGAATGGAGVVAGTGSVAAASAVVGTGAVAATVGGAGGAAGAGIAAGAVGFSMIGVLKVAAIVAAVATVGLAVSPRPDADRRREGPAKAAPVAERQPPPPLRTAPGAQLAATVAPEQGARSPSRARETTPSRDSVVVSPPVVEPTAAPPALARPTDTPASLGPAGAGDEFELIKAMQLALRDGDAAHALALVREHERRFPSSAWAPERDGVRVLAICSSASTVEAEKVGQAFLDGHPLSPLAARVRASCGVRERR